MSDDFEPFATAGSGKSDPEVAFDLLNKLKGQGVWGERNKAAILDMYAECLDAVKGYRAYEGQKRVIVPTIDTAPVQSQVQPQAQPQVQAPVAAPQPAMPAPQPAQATAQQAPPANPVQTQQYQIQQPRKTGANQAPKPA